MLFQLFRAFLGGARLILAPKFAQDRRFQFPAISILRGEFNRLFTGRQRLIE